MIRTTAPITTAQNRLTALSHATRRAGTIAAVGVLLASGAALAGPALTASARPAGPSGSPASSAAASVRPVCGTAARLHARCFAELHTGAAANSAALSADIASKAPAGLGASDLQNAYQVGSRAGGASRRTVAIVDAYDDPTAEADLAVYRKEYGLSSCTTANGCFTKVNERGQQGKPPPVDQGWAVEISLDLDMVSAACPKCHILLVEGDSSSLQDLGKSVDTAVRLGAASVSNSYGTQEYNGMRPFYRYYQHPGVPVQVSSGDSGFGPATFPSVTPGVASIGGTVLHHANNARGWTERAWAGSSSGCSAYVPQPSFQHGTHCEMRLISDVSASAVDLAIYDSTPNTFGVPAGWVQVDGTSASSPFVSALIARAANPAHFTTAYLYAHASSLRDVVGGTNGYCGGDYLCKAVVGYDGPTGVGSPRGLAGL